MGPKNLATLAIFISSLRLTPRRKKCSRTNKEGPNCQENQDHERKKWYATKGNLPERPKGKHKCNESTMGVCWRSNSRRNCQLHIKCLQLTSWPHLCGHDP